VTGYKLIKAVLAMSSVVPFAACSAHPGDPNAYAVEADTALGSELQLCKNCPIFVRVPDAPKNLRPIRYVAKFELTWNQYLASYDDGACDIPDDPFIFNKTKPGHYPRLAGNIGSKSPRIPASPAPDSKPRPNKIRENIDKFRVDWPAAYIGPDEIKCYVNWLQNKTGYVIAAPTEKEWEWFASAGNPSNKYPWGNSPDKENEALSRTKVPDDVIYPPYIRSRKGSSLVTRFPGIKVGYFLPNPWGIYDLMGNIEEYTQDIEWRNNKSNSIYKKIDRPSIIIKGGSHSTNRWVKEGIKGRIKTAVLERRYGYFAAHRLILIEKEGER